MFCLMPRRTSPTSFWIISVVCCLLIAEALAVAVTEVRVLSDSSKQEYVLHGEGVTLSCHYVLEPSEKVTEVEWQKDGILVYLWSLDDKPKAYDVLKGHVDSSVNSPSTLYITKASMEMQGTYTCKVRTNGKTAQNDVYLMVIVDACYEDSWRTYTDMITCTETINMHCVGIFPKPSPVCGIYSESTGKYLRSVPFDSINLLWNRTYEVSLNRRFTIDEWINHTDIVFRCYMVVLGTPWRSGIRHKMFGNAGCTTSPPDIPNGAYNLTSDPSCWGYPGEGSFAEYFCDEGYSMIGTPIYKCRNGRWLPDAETVSDQPFATRCSDDCPRLVAEFIWWAVPLLVLSVLRGT